MEVADHSAAALPGGCPRCYCFTQPEINTSLAYVTGSHAAKFGVQYEWGGDNVNDFVVGQSINYTLRNNAVLVLNTAYGANWLRPSYVLPGRLIKPNVQIDF